MNDFSYQRAADTAPRSSCWQRHLPRPRPTARCATGRATPSRWCRSRRRVFSQGAGARRDQYSMHSYGAQFCEVRVNEVTGEIRVSRWLGSFDTGRIMNPSLAEYHMPVHADVPVIDII